MKPIATCFIKESINVSTTTIYKIEKRERQRRKREREREREKEVVRGE
jgi:hypothetical protein